MRKHLLTLLFLMGSMTLWAQSGWSDPSSEYQEQTVVYVSVESASHDIFSGVTEPQVAAFIGDQIRALSTSYMMADNYKVYTLRVGGTNDDVDSQIDFKVYDPISGLVYPLEMYDESGEQPLITYKGDFTYEENQSIQIFRGLFTPANQMRVTYYANINAIRVNVGEKMTVSDGALIEYIFKSDTNGEEMPATTPEGSITWDLTSMDDAGNPTSYYVTIEEGNDVITALNSTPDPVIARAVAGGLTVDVNILVYQPVTSIAIADADIYLGVGSFVPNVVYNNNETSPTSPGVTFTVDSDDVIQIVDGTTILPVALGTATVTAVANDNPDAEVTFQVNVLSALQEFSYEGNIEFTIIDEYSKDMTGYVNAPIFNWVYDDSGAPVVEPNEEYTLTSLDPSTVLVETDDTGSKYIVTAMKKGTTTLVFTSKYDTTKSVEVEVIVKQAVYDATITTINGESVEGAETRPMADVYVGETVTAVAELNPADADFNSFEMRFVNSDGMEIQGYEDCVSVTGTNVANGVCTMNFVFTMLPAEDFYLQIFVDGTRMGGNVLLNVYNRVQSIDVSLQPEYWIGESAQVLDFKYDVTPDDGVKNDRFTVESSAPAVAEILFNNETGVYELHAYAPGEVAFTFTSDDNPDVVVEHYTVIKRTPTGVNIVSVAGQVIDEGSNGVQVAVGQVIEAVAQVEPGDANVDTFEMFIVNGNLEQLGDAEVEIISTMLSDDKRTCVLRFRFITVPDVRVLVNAVVNGDITDQVPLLVVQSVNKIELSETEKIIWYGNAEMPEFSITATAYPTDATNKNILVEVNDNFAIEYTGYDDVNGVHNFRVNGKGDAVITFTSEDNSSVVETCAVTVKRRVDELFVNGIGNTFYNDGEEQTLTVTFSPEDADFDASALSINVTPGQLELPYDWEVFEISDGELDGNNVNYTIVARALCPQATINVEYDAASVEDGGNTVSFEQHVEMAEKLTVAEGWSWISLINSTIPVSELSKTLIEARSKTDLVFNDAKYGPFGTLDYITEAEAYKVNMLSSASVVTMANMFSNDGSIADKKLEKGWNWVSYPYEYAYAVEDIFDASAFSEGDIILSKDRGFVTCTGGAWLGDLAELMPQEGYMVYTNASATVSMPGRFTMEQGYFTANTASRAAARGASMWVIDGSKFANTMPVIARVDIEETDDLVVVAFVDDECRGEGGFINGLAFVSVAGEAGENVIFRLYNKVTGEMFDIDGGITFAGMAGSVKAPVAMRAIGIPATGTTGIVDINTIDSNAIVAIYDVAGRKVENMTSGIYIIKVRENDKIVTKRVSL
ncbi:MAG: T9SS type A sorting domain-containing protein [Bacteroidaceae bacterium]|nr:T9SS type A sorting domain-containing protein [Bacteroidaceae bacterium]